MHSRSVILETIETALKTQLKLLPSTDAVQEEDVPCVVMEDREETVVNFDDILAQPARALRRRFRLVIHAFGKTKRERDDTAEQVEMLVAPALTVLMTMGGEFRVKCWFAGVGFSQTRLGTSIPAFVAGQFYDAEYFTPSYL